MNAGGCPANATNALIVRLEPSVNMSMLPRQISSMKALQQALQWQSRQVVPAYHVTPTAAPGGHGTSALQPAHRRPILVGHKLCCTTRQQCHSCPAEPQDYSEQHTSCRHSMSASYSVSSAAMRGQRLCQLRNMGSQ